MKRSTVYLDAELEIQLKLEAMRQKRPMAELLREALRRYLSGLAPAAPPGAGAFASGQPETAERAEEVLAESGFGEDPG